jgi:rod shape-determining protein MreC
VYNRRRARILLAVLVLLALVLVTVDFRSDGSSGDGPLGRLRGIASTVFGPVQDGLATIVSPIGNSLSGIGDVFDARAENAQLRSQLERLEERRLSYDDVLRENEELRQLLEIQERSELRTRAAQVIANGPSNFEWTITLDVGSADGVQRDMPVINGDGLVGRVIQTTTDTSRVLLAVDPSFQAAAAHAQSGETGAVQGNGGEPMIYRPLDPEAELEVGDEIVTSRYSNGVFPAGIPIGTVDATDPSSGLLSRTIQVRPWVDFTRLQTVLVVLYEPEQVLPSDDLGDGLEFERPDVAPTPTDDPSTETVDPFDPFAPTETPSDGASPSPSDGATGPQPTEPSEGAG